LKLFIEFASSTICCKENSNNRSKLIPLLFATSIETTCDSLIQNWEKGKEHYKIVILVHKQVWLHIYFIIIIIITEEGISIKICWDTSKVQNSRIELIKSAYCTLLDVPHKSKIPESGKITINFNQEFLFNIKLNFFYFLITVFYVI